MTNEPIIIAPGESAIFGDDTLDRVKTYPGREQAEALGYTFRRLWSNLERATYTKGNLALTIKCLDDCDELEFVLSASVQEAHVNIGPLPFPHSRFRVFEQRLQDILEKCRDLFPSYLEK